MNRYEQLLQDLSKAPKVWLITGAAGFIGSNLLETLLKLNQKVVGLDNFATGHQRNFNEVQSLVSPKQWARFQFIEGDIRDLEDCQRACEGVDYVLHQAALGSVPRSIDDPITTNEVNINGFLNLLVAARNAEVQSFTYAASSSTYGDHPGLPKTEAVIGNPLSSYAVTKYTNELYASVFARNYGFKTIGLRYFNVFGKRQDPDGAYAAVIPKWIAAMIRNDTVYINGEGETSRDFCFIDNVVQANILAATTPEKAKDNVFNVACNDRTSLKQLYDYLRTALAKHGVNCQNEPCYRAFRSGDVLHSQADISKIEIQLGYTIICRVKEGIEQTMKWYSDNLK